MISTLQLLNKQDLGGWRYHFFLGTKHWHVFDLNPSFVHYCTRYALFNGPTGNMVLLALQVSTWPLKYICLVVVYLNLHIKDHMVLAL